MRVDFTPRKCKYLDTFEVFASMLEKKGFKVTKMTKKEVRSFEDQWLINFVDEDLLPKAKTLCYAGDSNFLWHAFSYNLMGGWTAESFDLLPKDEEVILFDNFGNRAYRVDKFCGITTKDLDYLFDVNVTNAKFTWTYTHTHEECMNLGPYFYHKDQ